VIEHGHLDPVRAAASRHGLTVALGTVERATDRGGHSLYCSRVMVGPDGSLLSVHRKLMPTYEERLVWATGDGAGLLTHPVADFRVGALNCWENWMPLARAALYGAGEDLHIALWPGSRLNTADITRFIAREGRCYVASVCGLLREQDLPSDLPLRDRIAPTSGELILDGGTALAGPDATWMVEPRTGGEELVVADLELGAVHRERQNFDVCGHYARPDVLQLRVDLSRQTAVRHLEPDDAT
ncbi:MAG: nitrilase-related carbon-nitrogen hydrolase, partial [Planctomycetota bacterium]